MGTWSVTLYGSDAANDIRDNVRELFKAPFDGDEIVAALTKTYPNLADKKDEEYPDMWLVLADQFHAHAVEAPRVFDTANAIIETGLDLKMKRAQSMVERDLAKRAKVLAELSAKWAKPHPKPVKRKVQEKPDAFVFEIGDCVAYPVKNTGKTINPYFAKPEADRDWRHDGYGAMGVLARGHYLGVFAWYAVSRLSLFRPAKPSLDACAAAMIESQAAIIQIEKAEEKPDLCIFASRLTPAHARKMGFESIGRLAPNDKAIAKDLAGLKDAKFLPGVCLAGELSGFGTRAPSSVPLSRYLSVRG
jgi:hypothetical protein